MLAPFLCSLSGIIYISIDLYLEYVKKNCFTTANNLKELCFFHLNSNRASTLYSKQETESLSKEIIINIDAYINIIKEASSISTQLNIQNINDKCKKNMIKLFKIADDLNYITLQTSAHNIEIIVIYLVIQRTKLINIYDFLSPIVRAKNKTKIKKIFQIIFLICLTEMNIYSIIISFTISFLLLRILFL